MYDVIIIGGGPAGLSAGIYAARGGLKTVIVENKSIGGQAQTAHEIQNYPGISAIGGFDLCYAMMQQCLSFGVDFALDKITACDLKNKKITLESGNELSAKFIIIATGASPRKLDVENESRFLGKGVSYCATCDGAFFKGKTVAVIGGGNTAVEDALYLEKLAKKVYLVHRRDALRADKILCDRLEKSTVEVIWNSVVQNLDGNDALTQMTLKNIKNDALNTVYVDGVFIAVGQLSEAALFDGVQKTSGGYIVTDENMRTNIDGVFAVGDVREKSLRQVITACSDGSIAGAICAKEI